MKKLYLFTSILAVSVLYLTAAHAQTINTIAGTMGNGNDDPSSPPLTATTAHLKAPFAVFVNTTDSDVFISDQNNNKVKELFDVDGKLYQIGGSGFPGYKNGRGDTARFWQTEGLWINYSGDTILVTDVQNHVVRMMAKSGGYYFVSTIAGTADSAGNTGDAGPATSAKLNLPYSVWRDNDRSIYIADAGNHNIRKINNSGVITTYAGTGTAGSMGDSAAATSAQLNTPTGIWIDGGMMYIADQGNHKIRKIDMGSGIITTFAGTGTSGSSGDGSGATSAQLNHPTGISVYDGYLYIADRDNNRIRRVDISTGIIKNVAGTGTAGSSGDGGPIANAQFKAPTGVYVDFSGLYIADQGNHVIRKSDVPVAIRNVQPLNAKIYPNPSKAQFVIELPPTVKTTQVEVFNMIGSNVYSATISTSKMVIDLSAQPNGVYSLHLSAGNAASVQKIVVAH